MERLASFEEEDEPYRELAYRRLGGIAVRLLWEVNTINTVVEVVDYNKKTYSLIPTPEGAKPNEVFERPFVTPRIYPKES